MTSDHILDSTIAFEDLAFTAGLGITLASGQIGVNPTVVQQRVGGTCAAGTSVRQVNQDGSVVCETDDVGAGDITGVNVAAPLSGGGATGEVSLSIAPNGITAAHIGTNAVGPDEVIPNSLTADDLNTNSVLTDEIAPNAVASSEIADNSIILSDLFFNPWTEDEQNGLGLSDGSAPNIGANSLHWDRLGGVPSGFADGVDNAGSALVRTVVVSPVGTAAQNGTALLNAWAALTGASSTSPYVLKLEPGIYSLGTGRLLAKQWVDIEGSGVQTTTILGDGTSGHVVSLGPHQELRDVTVNSTGGGTSSNALAATGANVSIRDARVIATGGSGVTQGLNVSFADTAQIRNTEIRALASAGFTQAIVAFNSTLRMRGSVVEAAGGITFNRAFDLQTGGASTVVTVLNSQIDASGSSSYAVHGDGGSAATIFASMLSAETNTVSGNSLRAISSMLFGGPVSGAVTCAGTYDEAYAFHASGCPS